MIVDIDIRITMVFFLVDFLTICFIFKLENTRKWFRRMPIYHRYTHEIFWRGGISSKRISM